MHSLKPCIPASDLFRSQSEAFLALVAAVSFKQPCDEVYPGKVHFLECSYNIADQNFEDKLIRSGLLEALQSGKYEAFACDIGPNCEWVSDRSRNGFPCSKPTSTPISDEEYWERAAKNAAWLRSRYSGYIHLENLNYFPTGAYERVCEPDFIAQLLEVTNLGLLLDIGHAVVSAHYLSYQNPMAYIQELPLQKVREIQLGHAGMLNGVFEDLHEIPDAGDLALVDEILSLSLAVEYLTVEYYRNGKVLYEFYRSMTSGLLRSGMVSRTI
jgi:uncharacterized protein